MLALQGASPSEEIQAPVIYLGRDYFLPSEKIGIHMHFLPFIFACLFRRAPKAWTRRGEDYQSSLHFSSEFYSCIMTDENEPGWRSWSPIIRRLSVSANSQQSPAGKKIVSMNNEFEIVSCAMNYSFRAAFYSQKFQISWLIMARASNHGRCFWGFVDSGPETKGPDVKLFNMFCPKLRIINLGSTFLVAQRFCRFSDRSA